MPMPFLFSKNLVFLGAIIAFLVLLFKRNKTVRRRVEYVYYNHPISGGPGFGRKRTQKRSKRRN